MPFQVSFYLDAIQNAVAIEVPFPGNDVDERM
jgi:hypothetical protein